jgi:hypothetical protein
MLAFPWIFAESLALAVSSEPLERPRKAIRR